MKIIIHLASIFLLVLSVTTSPLYATPLYSNNFDGGESFGAGISGSFFGVTTTESVQGYSALAEYDGLFLRNTSDGNPAPASVLGLSGFTPFQLVDLQFSLAIIDSWDGSSFPPAPSQAPDFFNVNANGLSIFSETFTNLTGLGGTQSYAGPALASEVQLGFENGVNRQDSAYLINLSASADNSGNLELSLFASGSGWIDLGVGATEESWGIDNISVTATPVAPVPEPSTMLLLGSGLIGLIGYNYRRGKQTA